MNDIEYGDYLHYFFNYTYIADKKEDKVSIKKEIFKDILDKFETEEMRLYCEDMIEKMDTRMLQIPSSTSLKYHNKTQCQDGGAAYHVLMVCTIGNYLLDLKYIKEKFKQPKKRDCIRIALMFHDNCKTNGGKYTVHEHPLLAAEWVKKTKVEHDVKQGLKDYIGSLISVHSGEWSKSNRSSVILPEPENDEQFFVHACDIIGSRSNLDMIYTDEQITAVNRLIKE